MAKENERFSQKLDVIEKEIRNLNIKLDELEPHIFKKPSKGTNVTLAVLIGVFFFSAFMAILRFGDNIAEASWYVACAAISINFALILLASFYPYALGMIEK